MATVEKNPYEITFILKPDLAEEDFTAKVKHYTQFITKAQGEVVNQEVWGLRKLAYPIEKYNTGYYVYTECKAPGDLVHEIEAAMRIDDDVIRYLSVRLNKHAVAYNEKRRSKFKSKAKEKAQAE